MVWCEAMRRHHLAHKHRILVAGLFIVRSSPPHRIYVRLGRGGGGLIDICHASFDRRRGWHADGLAEREKGAPGIRGVAKHL